MTPDDNAIRLNESQRRHYEVLFARLERTLAHLDTATRGGDPRLHLTDVHDDLPARFVEDAPRIIAQARQELAALADTLSLRPRVESRRRVCRALLTAELNGLTDATSTRLRGFGEVDSSVGEHVDPALAQLLATVGRLADLLT